jgi:hypothetical protein
MHVGTCHLFVVALPEETLKVVLFVCIHILMLFRNPRKLEPKLAQCPSDGDLFMVANHCKHKITYSEIGRRGMHPVFWGWKVTEV